MEKLRVCFLGTGSMGSAVLEGMIASGHPLEQISATTKSVESAARFRSRGISAMAIDEAADANALLAGDADLIVLGVKPYQIKDVLSEIKDEIAPNAVVISMAAGIKLATMAEVMPGIKNLIRTMPNTPALVGMGVTGVAPAKTASAEAVEATIELFDSVGAALEITEDQIDALSAISGSGPAWVFYIMEQWEKIALKHGFSAGLHAQRPHCCVKNQAAAGLGRGVGRRPRQRASRLKPGPRGGLRAPRLREDKAPGGCRLAVSLLSSFFKF